MYYLTMLLVVASIAGCGTVPRDAGFDPEGDAKLALQKAERPHVFSAAELRKRDPRATYALQMDPRKVEKIYIQYVNLSGDVSRLAHELEDTRRMYNRAVLQDLKISEESGQVRVSLGCRANQSSCTLRNAVTIPTPHRPKVFPAVLYGKDQTPERIYDAVYRPGLHRFAVLIPAGDLAKVLGKELHIKSLYDDFDIVLGGTLVPRAHREVGRLSEEFVANHPSRVEREALVEVDRNTPEGAYLLGNFASEFPLPSLFVGEGATSVDLLLGAAKLTREDNAWDCWVGGASGTLTLSPFWQQMLIEAVVSHGQSIYRANQPDCGKTVKK